MKILLVEDDPNVAQTLAFLLSSYTYAVDIASDGETGLQMAEAFEYDLMLLDIILPGLDGISLCQELRARGLQMPILLLTGRDGAHQKAIALNAGADDYVVKPFDAEELIARVQALLRRGGAVAQPCLKCGDLCIDPSSREVTYNGHVLALTPKEYAILELFLRHQQKVFSAKALLEHAWNSVDSPGEEAVRVHIKEIRQKLKAAGAPPHLIKTVYGAGYRLNSLDATTLTQPAKPLPATETADLKAINQELQAEIKRLQTMQQQLYQQNQNLEILRREAELALDLTRTGWWSWDIAADQLTWSEQTFRLLGYAPNEVIPTRQAWRERIHPDDREWTDQALARDLSTQADGEVEYRVVHPDGSLHWLLVRARGLYDRDDQPIQMVGIVLDISERKRHEADRKQAEAELREMSAALSNAVEGISRLDAEGRYISVNEAYARMMGYSPSEMVGMHWQQTLDASELEAMQVAYQQMLHTGKVELTAKGIRKDGSLFHKQLFMVAVYDDEQQFSGHHCFMKDISEQVRLEAERHQAEFQLHQREEQLRIALEVGHIASWNWNPITNRIIWNDNHYRLFGYEPGEIEPSYQVWQQHVYANDLARVEQSISEAVAQQAAIDLEYRIVRRDGSIRWVIAKGRGLYDEAGQVLRIVGIVFDHTERKQAAADLEQQLAREHLVAEITNSIRQTLDLSQVLQRAVDQVRQALQTDRVIIFRFQPNWQGNVITESVGAEWLPILSTTIHDPCFEDRFIEPYRQGRVAAIADLHKANLASCYRELLENLQVQANLVVPILQREPLPREPLPRELAGEQMSEANLNRQQPRQQHSQKNPQTDNQTQDQLWGLLIAHHCASPRQWQTREIELLQQLANQLGIAIQQSELYQQTRRELLERRRMQTALQASEERFRSLSASAPIGIRQMNADGICLYTNPFWQEMSGLSQEDSLGDGWTAAIHPDDRDAVITQWNSAIQQQQTFTQEFRLLTPTEAVRWVTAHVAPMRSTSGELIGYVSMERDVTERLQAEQKIRQQAALIDIATDAIFVRDLQNQILFWSQGAERLYGWTKAEVLGKTEPELFGQTAAQLEAGLSATIVQGFWQGELDQVTKTGRDITVASRWTLVRDQAGEPESILVVNTDVTEKKLLEAQFYRAQRLESLGTLASGISHDLNNVLTPILAISQLIRLRHPNLDARSQEMWQTLEDSARRGANLVEQILTFARGTEGKRITLQPEHLLLEVVQVVKQTFPKSIEIQQNFSGPLWSVVADPTHLHQVLMNLCVNARDAMPNGGVLTLSAENCTVDAALAQLNLDAQAGDYVLVTIADTGTGIPPALLNRIFDPFFTTKAPGKGTGLGLSTVLGIVRNYGGFLQVASEVGQGSQFKVYLPATKSITTTERKQEKPQQGNQELILIVDDDITVQRTSQFLLESHHYKTLVANNGVEALSLYRKHQTEIRAVLIDIMMPTMDGITTVRMLREMDSQIKIIAISGLSSHRETALAVGANVFLTKPYAIEELLMQLYGLIGREVEK